MKNIVIAILALAVVAPVAFNSSNTVLAGSCAEERLIYGQDYQHGVYGYPDDTAIIKDRNHATIVLLRQRKDDYIVWPATYKVEIKKGEIISYTASGSRRHRLKFDILDSNSNFVEAVDTLGRGNNFSIPVKNDGFIRFNSGQSAIEYNKLTLCAAETAVSTSNSPASNQYPVWSLVSDKYVDANQTLQFSVHATDPDGDFLNYSALYLPNGASFNSNTRVFSWTPNSNQIGTYQVAFRASDGSKYADIFITIYVDPSYVPPYIPPYTPPAQTPIFVDFNPPLTAREGQVYTATVRATSGSLPITYKIISGPSGLTINEKLGVIIWVPNFSQGGTTYAVNIGASNGTLEASRIFYITVEDVNYTVPVPPAPQPPVYVPPAPKPIPAVPLKISDIAVDWRADNDVVILFKTNYPASGEVMYDLFSEADKTKDFTYGYRVAEKDGQTTNHSVSLLNLNGNRSYYLRAVAKRGSETVVSQEIILVKTGKSANFLAFLGVFFDWLLSPWLLWLIIIFLLIFILAGYRKRRKLSDEDRLYQAYQSRRNNGGASGNADEQVQENVIQ